MTWVWWLSKEILSLIFTGVLGDEVLYKCSRYFDTPVVCAQDGMGGTSRDGR